MGGNNLKLNLNSGLQTQNWRQLDTSGNDAFANKAKAIAQMVYGSGMIGEGVNGGKGHIGIVGDKVIKFNTKSGERANLNKLSKNSVAYQDMKESCNNLRMELLKMANSIELNSEDLDKIRSALNISTVDDKDVVDADAGLLERTTAAAVLKKLVGAYAAKNAAETKALVDTLWDGHAPTYGKSVASFRAAINEHNEKIGQTLRNEYDALVKQAVKDSNEIADVNNAMNSGLKNKVGDWCGHIEKWYGRMCGFLLGLVPENPKNGDALRALKETLDASSSGIKSVLEELKSLASKEDGNYGRPQNFGNRKYSTVSELMIAGFGEVWSRFDKMLRDASSGPAFADGSKYPDFSQPLANQKVPNEFKEIAADIRTLYGTFRNAIDTFANIGREASKDVEETVDFMEWNKQFAKDVGNAVEQFDKKIEEMAPNGHNRKERLKALKENPQNVDFKGLAKSLNEMKNMTYHHEGDGKKRFSKTFAYGWQAKSEKIEDNDASFDDIKDLNDFKKFVLDLILTKGVGWQTIFVSAYEDPNVEPCVPRGLLGIGTRNFLWDMRAGNENGKMNMTAMRYFERLHEVASTFGVINGKGIGVV